MVPKSGRRKIKISSRYRQDTEANIVIDTDKDDLLTYRDAIKIVKMNNGKKPLTKRWGLCTLNSVWELVVLPEDVRLIRCKWI